MYVYGASVWKKIPFLRLLIPFSAGIATQWYASFKPGSLWITLSLLIFIIIIFSLLPVRYRFRWRVINGFAVAVFYYSLGAIILHYKNAHFNSHGIHALYHENDTLIATLDETPVEKTRSIKAAATISILTGTKLYRASGRIIIYFKKTGSVAFQYGQQFLLTQKLQPIKNSGNPGSFNYVRYCLSQNITHQVFLDTSDYTLLPSKQTSRLHHFIYDIRERIIGVLHKYIHGDKEIGLSEALLIGYKDDLDQALVQSYTNTGVVHVIAISGLHLGLIYALLLLCFRPLKKYPALKWLRLLLILSGIWIFTLLAGAQPSILRSAVMFTCLATGECLSRRSSMLNSLAFSAFLLLCINPFWLWDAGFQLSYAAVLSIVLFMRRVYNCIFLKIKMLDMLWKLNAVTIAAQVLTVPICLYHFHQFPNYFLFTNIVAVPLSSIILIGEIFLCAIAVVPTLAALAGKLLSWLIWLMNSYVEFIDSMPFSTWDGLYVDTLQVFLLYIFISFVAQWLLEKSVTAFKITLAALLLFFMIRSHSFFIAACRHQVVVYNIPRKRIIDIFDTRNLLTIADSSVLNDEFVQQFHTRPCRTKNRVRRCITINAATIGGNCIMYRSIRMLFLDRKTTLYSQINKLTVDVIVVSGKAVTDFDKLGQTFIIKQVVLDASATSYTRSSWKKYSVANDIPFHDVTSDGAFVMNLR